MPFGAYRIRITKLDVFFIATDIYTHKEYYFKRLIYFYDTKNYYSFHPNFRFFLYSILAKQKLI